MITKIKSVLNNTKFWQALLTLVLSYLGYSEVTQRMPSPDVTIEVAVPDKVEHSHKDWTEDIKRAVEKSDDAHEDKFH